MLTSDRETSLGKITNVFIDEAQQYYLALEIGSWFSRKQVLLPLTQFQILPSERQLYVPNLSAAELERLPSYKRQATRTEPQPHEVAGRESYSVTATYPVEASPPLEASAPLEAPVQSWVPAMVTAPTTAIDSVPAAEPQLVTLPPQPSASEIVDEETVQLLEERLIIDRRRRKVGEVIVRKVIETRMVEVPVRWEKLVVEQVSPEPRQLATIDLGSGSLDRLELREPAPLPNSAATEEELPAIPISLAHQILSRLAKSTRFHEDKVRLVFEDQELHDQYRQWLSEQQRSVNLG